MTDQPNILSTIARRMLEDFEILRAVTHAGERGRAVEDILRDFLRQYLPGRYAVATGFVVGKGQRISPQCDIIIYDRLDTPILLGASDMVMVPADCALAVIEVKSNLDTGELVGDGQKKGALQQIESIRALEYEIPLEEPSFQDCKPLGLVFAFEKGTNFDTLGKHTRAFREREVSDQRYMANCICVLNKDVRSQGLICYYDASNNWFHMAPTERHPVVVVEAKHLTLAIWFYFLLERMSMLLENRTKAKTERELAKRFKGDPDKAAKVEHGCEAAAHYVLTPNMAGYFGIVGNWFEHRNYRNGIDRLTLSKAALRARAQD